MPLVNEPKNVENVLIGAYTNLAENYCVFITQNIADMEQGGERYMMHTGAYAMDDEKGMQATLSSAPCVRYSAGGDYISYASLQPLTAEARVNHVKMPRGSLHDPHVSRTGQLHVRDGQMHEFADNAGEMRLRSAEMLLPLDETPSVQVARQLKINRWERALGQ